MNSTLSRTAGIISFTVLLTSILLFIILSSYRVEAASYQNTADAGTVTCTYASYRIQDGDTLWSIADTYKYAGEDTADFISMIKSLNGMTSADIHAGNYILIPLYQYA